MNANQTNRRLSRRQMLRIMAQGVTAAGLSALAAACGGGANTQPSAGASPQPGGAQGTAQAPAQTSGTTTLQFITPAAVGKERDLYTSFIDDFQKENPNTKVNVSFEAWTDYMTKLPTILASGSAPD